MFNRSSKKQSIRKTAAAVYEYVRSFDNHYHVYRIANLFADGDTYMALLKGEVEGDELVVQEKITLAEYTPDTDMIDLSAEIKVRYYADKYSESMAL